MGSQYSFVEALVQAACSLLETLLTHGGSTSPTMETFLGASTVSWAPKAVNMSAISSWPYLKHVWVINLLSSWRLDIQPDCQFEWSHVLVIQLIDICSSLQQNLDNFLSATTDSIVEWCGVSVDTMVIIVLSWIFYLSPGIIFLVDILSHIESDQDFFNIASHGGIIEVQRHVLFSPAWPVNVLICERLSEKCSPPRRCCHYKSSVASVLLSLPPVSAALNNTHKDWPEAEGILTHCALWQI